MTWALPSSSGFRKVVIFFRRSLPVQIILDQIRGLVALRAPVRCLIRLGLLLPLPPLHARGFIIYRALSVMWRRPRIFERSSRAFVVAVARLRPARPKFPRRLPGVLLRGLVVVLLHVGPKARKSSPWGLLGLHQSRIGTSAGLNLRFTLPNG